MAATVSPPQVAHSNRRSRVRQKVHVPAYATFDGTRRGGMVELHEVLDISENGLALQCSSPMEVNQAAELCLDLAEAADPIRCTARVSWVDAGGRVGFALPDLTEAAKRQLSEWLFLNAMAAAANAEPVSDRPLKVEDHGDAPNKDSQSVGPRQDHSDVLSAASAVQREAESLGSDVEAVLALIASRSRSLLHASGAAIALQDTSDKKNEQVTTMICRASSGGSAPPVGMTLQVGSGFSGECVCSGKLLRCEDTETDERVDLQSCRALGIRSIIAAPVRMEKKVIGLLEIFSAQSAAFRENDSAVLQRLVETIQAALQRPKQGNDSSAPPPAPPKTFSAPPGSVLFAHPPEKPTEKHLAGNHEKDQDKVGGIRLPRAHLYLLFATAATIFLALGFLSEPWIQEKVHGRVNNEQTVLASSNSPVRLANAAAPVPSADSANIAQLRDLAAGGDAAAENALGLLYAAGDDKQGVARDESEAARWFSKAAEHGNIPAQSKLGSLYWGGRGVAKDDNQAYFWTVLARANGDSASKALAPFIATRLTQAQRTVIEQQAEQWLERHESAAKSGH